MYSYYQLPTFSLQSFTVDLYQWLKTITLKLKENLKSISLWLTRVVFSYPHFKSCKGYSGHAAQLSDRLNLCQPDIPDLISARIYPSRNSKSRPEYVMYLISTSETLKYTKEFLRIWYRVINCQECSSFHRGQIYKIQFTPEILTDSHQYRKFLTNFEVY